MSPWHRRLAAAAAAAAGLLCLGGWFFVSLGDWFQREDAPRAADRIVIMAGNPERALKAGQLYAQGYAPEIWIVRPSREPWMKNLERIGLTLPSEEELYRRALLKNKVPRSRIHFYGEGSLSTVDEAFYLREALGSAPTRLLLVSNRTHLCRARRIFQDYMPWADVRAVASDDEPANPRWWTDKNLAGAIVGELIHMVYYLAGGRFEGHAAPLAHAQSSPSKLSTTPPGPTESTLARTH